MKDIIIGVVDFVTLLAVGIAGIFAVFILSEAGTMLGLALGLAVFVGACFAAGFWIVVSRICGHLKQIELLEKQNAVSLQATVNILESMNEKSSEKIHGLID